MRKKVLVLGANGFIGSHLVDRLVKDGYSVRAFARYENSALFSKSEHIEIFKGDFLNQNDLSLAVRDVKYVVHLVSTTTPATSEKDPLIDLTTNVVGSVNLFQKCIEKGEIERVVFASSGGTVYGDDYPGRPYHETDPTNPISPYGIGKLAIENYLHYYHRVLGQDYLVLRISNPYGGRQRDDKQQGIMPILIKNIQEDLPIQIYGDGSMVRDYIYINDLVEIISKSLDKDMSYKTYNIGSGKGLSINELVAIIEELTGKKAIVEYSNAPKTFVKSSVLDSSRIASEIQSSHTDIRDGLRAMYSDYLKSTNS